MTAQPPIVDHVFRAAADGHDRSGRCGGPVVRRGMCVYRGTCNRPADDHITAPDYQARRREATC